jgi:hypothetical protein
MAVALGLGLGTFLACVAELYRGDLPPGRRLVLGALALALGVLLFPASVALRGAGVAALLIAAAALVRPRLRVRLRLLAGGAAVLFLCATTYLDRPEVLALGLAPLLAEAVRPRGHRPPIRLYFLGALLAAVCVIVFRYQSFITIWKMIYLHVPGAGAIRAVSRMSIIMLIPESIGFACFCARMRAERRAGLAAAVAVLCALEQGVTTPSYDKHAQRALVAELSRRIDDRCEAFFYSPRHDGRLPWESHLDAMWAQLDHRVPTINGYSGFSPPGWLPLYEANIASDQDLARVGAALAHWIRARRLRPDRVCWIGGEQEAIRLREPAAHPRNGEDARRPPDRPARTR